MPSMTTSPWRTRSWTNDADPYDVHFSTARHRRYGHPSENVRVRQQAFDFETSELVVGRRRGVVMESLSFDCELLPPAFRMTAVPRPAGIDSRSLPPRPVTAVEAAPPSVPS